MILHFLLLLKNINMIVLNYSEASLELDTSTEPEQHKLPIFISQRDTDGRLVVSVSNKKSVIYKKLSLVLVCIHF